MDTNTLTDTNTLILCNKSPFTHTFLPLLSPYIFNDLVQRLCVLFLFFVDFSRYLGFLLVIDRSALVLVTPWSSHLRRSQQTPCPRRFKNIEQAGLGHVIVNVKMAGFGGIGVVGGGFWVRRGRRRECTYWFSDLELRRVVCSGVVTVVDSWHTLDMDMCSWENGISLNFSVVNPGD